MKKIFVFSVVIICTVMIIAISAIRVLRSDSPTTENPTVNTDIFDTFDDDAKDIENGIREEEQIRLEQFGGTSEKEIEETLLKLENGEITLRQIFADTFFAGDSLMNGLEIYGILSPDNLATQVSASLSHLRESAERIVSVNPSVLILHYGINMISTDEYQLNNFISSYSEVISELKAQLPSTRIIVSGIFPVDTSLATDVRFTMVEEYNEALSAMSEQAGVEFLDSSEAFYTDVDYYGADGIHVSAAFYSEAWLPYVIENKGIVG